MTSRNALSLVDSFLSSIRQGQCDRSIHSSEISDKKKSDDVKSVDISADLAQKSGASAQLRFDLTFYPGCLMIPAFRGLFAVSDTDKSQYSIGFFDTSSIPLETISSVIGWVCDLKVTDTKHGQTVHDWKNCELAFALEYLYFTLNIDREIRGKISDLRNDNNHSDDDANNDQSHHQRTIEITKDLASYQSSLRSVLTRSVSLLACLIRAIQLQQLDRFIAKWTQKQFLKKDNWPALFDRFWRLEDSVKECSDHWKNLNSYFTDIKPYSKILDVIITNIFNGFMHSILFNIRKQIEPHQSRSSLDGITLMKSTITLEQCRLLSKKMMQSFPYCFGVNQQANSVLQLAYPGVFNFSAYQRWWSDELAVLLPMKEQSISLNLSSLSNRSAQSSSSSVSISPLRNRLVKSDDSSNHLLEDSKESDLTVPSIPINDPPPSSSSLLSAEKEKIVTKPEQSGSDNGTDSSISEPAVPPCPSQVVPTKIPESNDNDNSECSSLEEEEDDGNSSDGSMEPPPNSTPFGPASQIAKPKVEIQPKRPQTYIGGTPESDSESESDSNASDGTRAPPPIQSKYHRTGDGGVTEVKQADKSDTSTVVSSVESVATTPEPSTAVSNIQPPAKKATATATVTPGGPTAGRTSDTESDGESSSSSSNHDPRRGIHELPPGSDRTQVPEVEVVLAKVAKVASQSAAEPNDKAKKGHCTYTARDEMVGRIGSEAAAKRERNEAAKLERRARYDRGRLVGGRGRGSFRGRGRGSQRQFGRDDGRGRGRGRGRGSQGHDRNPSLDRDNRRGYRSFGRDYQNMDGSPTRRGYHSQRDNTNGFNGSRPFDGSPYHAKSRQTGDYRKFQKPGDTAAAASGASAGGGAGYSGGSFGGRGQPPYDSRTSHQHQRASQVPNVWGGRHDPYAGAPPSYNQQPPRPPSPQPPGVVYPGPPAVAGFPSHSVMAAKPVGSPQPISDESAVLAIRKELSVLKDMIISRELSRSPSRHRHHSRRGRSRSHRHYQDEESHGRSIRTVRRKKPRHKHYDSTETEEESSQSPERSPSETSSYGDRSYSSGSRSDESSESSPTPPPPPVVRRRDRRSSSTVKRSRGSSKQSVRKSSKKLERSSPKRRATSKSHHSHTHHKSSSRSQSSRPVKESNKSHPKRRVIRRVNTASRTGEVEEESEEDAQDRDHQSGDDDRRKNFDLYAEEENEETGASDDGTDVSSDHPRKDSSETTMDNSSSSVQRRSIPVVSKKTRVLRDNRSSQRNTRFTKRDAKPASKSVAPRR